jgi:hypothetical protein
MHHIAFHSFKSESHKVFFSIKGQSVSKVSRHPRPKPTRIYNTKANIKKEMDKIEQAVHELREEVITLRADIEKLSTLVALLVVWQNQQQF